jgi:hypothetical protein
MMYSHLITSEMHDSVNRLRINDIAFQQPVLAEGLIYDI